MMWKQSKKMIGIILIMAGIGAAAFTGFQSLYPPGTAPEATPSTTPIVSPEVSPVSPETEPVPPLPEVPPDPKVQAEPDETDGLPIGKLVITPERKRYKDGGLTLRIPALGVESIIHDGTDREDLRNGVGLYDYAQLPGEGNRNVSIAGHRNGISNGKITDRAPFYYVDTLKEGDYLYLTDSAYIYRYLWENSTIVKANDWSPIYTSGYSSITLTSCHPIGISDHRIIIRGVLDEIFPYEKSFNYTVSSEEGSL